MPTCKLCNIAPAIPNSHIISKFFYRQLKKQTGYLIKTTPDYTTPQKIQDGPKESLLCSACEGKLSNWERETSQVLFHSASMQNDPQDSRFEVITNLDYRLIKLFSMSLIWRMGISALPEFSDVVFNGRHQEKMRLMLLNETPGEAYEYPCTLSGATYQGIPLEGILPL